MKNIRRLLIANRGEIACRIIKSCKNLGIESVAVFSDADRHALHVKLADLACYIGPAQSSASYLNSKAIIEAALKVKADAIHPGYGFLSESTELITLCEQNDVIFVGPSVESISQMGLKIEAKAIARELGIPAVPGYNGDDQSPLKLISEAKQIGFPLLIKASAGGGGKGMRIVHKEEEFEGALTQAKQESLKAFGNDRVLLEKYILRPRHIEVQVLGDTHGNTLHLFDRECSIQRNYQKVIEEAPACNLSDEVRQGLFDCAVRLAKHLNYRGAGTVEFIFDSDTQAAYFLEMNTRLQVEHPTTELVTGIDLVEWQIRIAAGETITFTQSGLSTRGHAIEARVNAENPANNYLPEIGTINLYREPEGEGLRVDSGVTQGSEVTPYYDSMIAKVIGFGESRGIATQRLVQGLNNFAIGGVKTNQDFLASLLVRPAFHQELSTQYINNEFPEGWKPWGEDLHIAIAAAAYASDQQHGYHTQMSDTPWQTLGSWRLVSRSENPAVMHLWLAQANDLLEVRISGSHGGYRVQVGNQNFELLLNHSTDQHWQVEVDGTKSSLDIVLQGQHVSISSPRLNRSYSFIGLEESQLGEAAALKAASTSIKAVMPGQVTDLLVKEGSFINEGETAVVMEAMKLIHNMPSPCSGTVKSVLCCAGDNVPDGKVLIEIDPSE